MILTHISKIKGLDKKEYAALRKLCLLNRGLANIVLYEIKENYKETGKTLSYNKCYHIVKEKYNYKQIQANCSQQTIKDICDSYKGFFNSLGCFRKLCCYWLWLFLSNRNDCSIMKISKYGGVIYET